MQEQDTARSPPRSHGRNGTWIAIQHDNHTTAIDLIDAQLEKINSQITIAREQDRLAMIRIVLAARVDSSNGETLDLELLLNQIGGMFKPDDEATENDESLQAALSAQVCKANYENRGAAVYDRNVPKKSQESRSPKQASLDISKLTQVVFDLKAEMGSMR